MRLLAAKAGRIAESGMAEPIAPAAIAFRISRRFEFNVMASHPSRLQCFWTFSRSGPVSFNDEVRRPSIDPTRAGVNIRDVRDGSGWEPYSGSREARVKHYQPLSHG